MTKHKSDDYKISAVKYYLKNNISLDDVSKIFNCPKQSLYRYLKMIFCLRKKVLLFFLKNPKKRRR